MMMQTSLQLGQQTGMHHIDWFFSQEMIEMQQGSEKMFSLGAHIRASLMGRMLLTFRARVPHQEGHGLDRIGRLGALLAPYEERGPLDEMNADDERWAEETWTWKKIEIFLGCRLESRAKP